ncbi:hypothetical protein Micbo1qcDRAFT_158177, partial [Microdochium bolleyi]
MVVGRRGEDNGTVRFALLLLFELTLLLWLPPSPLGVYAGGGTSSAAAAVEALLALLEEKDVMPGISLARLTLRLLLLLILPLVIGLLLSFIAAWWLSVMAPSMLSTVEGGYSTSLTVPWPGELLSLLFWPRTQPYISAMRTRTAMVTTTATAHFGRPPSAPLLDAEPLVPALAWTVMVLARQGCRCGVRMEMMAGMVRIAWMIDV